MLKIFAVGLICGHKAYLKESWNILDFVIVIAGLVEFILDFAKVKGVNLRALRTLRVLRPLKGLKTIPSLRK
jgi:hypothetical protein